MLSRFIHVQWIIIRTIYFCFQTSDLFSAVRGIYNYDIMFSHLVMIVDGNPMAHLHNLRSVGWQPAEFVLMCHRARRVQCTMRQHPASLVAVCFIFLLPSDFNQKQHVSQLSPTVALFFLPCSAFKMTNGSAGAALKKRDGNVLI